jgi:hypothetical protein
MPQILFRLLRVVGICLVGEAQVLIIIFQTFSSALDLQCAVRSSWSLGARKSSNPA